MRRLRIYDGQGRRVEKSGDDPELRRDWRADCGEAMLRKHARGAWEGKGRGIDSWKDKTGRKALAGRLREALRDESLPDLLRREILRGIEVFLLDELVEEVEGMPLGKGEGEEGAGILRRQREATLSSLRDRGKREAIEERLRRKKAAGHLVYDLFRRNRRLYAEMMVERLRQAGTERERYHALDRLVEHGSEALLAYLERCGEEEFKRCSAGAAVLIRREKPGWRGRLQEALERYHEGMEDDEFFVFRGLEALVPEDDPRYFDEAAVARTLAWWKENARRLSGRYLTEECLREKIREAEERWRKAGRHP